jgi:hypothetical protein
MQTRRILVIAASTALLCAAAQAEVTVTVDHNDSSQASAAFKFKRVPSPVKNDAAAKATFSIAAGQIDPNSGSLAILHDGNVPSEEDSPAENFFFGAGTRGGRIVVDLGSNIDIGQVNTYSWHPNTRGPQVYRLFGSDSKNGDNQATPENHGWQLIATVDTRIEHSNSGGQYGVSVSSSEGKIGSFRYLLFDCSSARHDDVFSNTFYSEIDVIDLHAAEPLQTAAPPAQILNVIEADQGKYQLVIDTTAAPDLTEWADKQLGPVVQEWYPKIVEMLPSDGYQAPERVAIRFRTGMGGTPASASQTQINCNVDWFRRNLKGEARGAVVHELVHIVQQYGLARRNNPKPSRTPGWLVEGIADYIRWFLYEPETRGAEITERNFPRARYDASYRITGNFLNWVTEQHDEKIVQKLNAAAREGRYSEELWKDHTGIALSELGELWRKSVEKGFERKTAVGE